MFDFSYHSLLYLKHAKQPKLAKTLKQPTTHKYDKPMKKAVHYRNLYLGTLQESYLSYLPSLLFPAAVREMSPRSSLNQRRKSSLQSQARQGLNRGLKLALGRSPPPRRIL